MMSYRFIILTVLMVFSNSLYAKCDQSGLQIITKQKMKSKVAYEKEMQEITIEDLSSHFKETRTLIRFVHTNNKEEKSLLNFLSPKEIKGAALLSWDSPQSQDQWLYLSGLKKLQRIAQGSKKKYFMGSDFTYADLEGEKISDYNYKCIKMLKCEKTSTCYMIEAKPKSRVMARKYGYKKRMILINKKTFSILIINYYNLKGKKFKILKNLKWSKVANTFRPNLSIMSRKKHRTYIKTKKRDLNQKIDPIFFTKRYLIKEMHMN